MNLPSGSDTPAEDLGHDGTLTSSPAPWIETRYDARKGDTVLVDINTGSRPAPPLRLEVAADAVCRPAYPHADTIAVKIAGDPDSTAWHVNRKLLR